MQQPVKKIIKDGGLHSEPPFYTLVVDANNLFKICASAHKLLNNKGENIGGIFQFLLQLRMMLTKRNFEHVYCFWDGEGSGKLRYNLYEDYKANRGKNYSDYGKAMSDFVRGVMDYSKKKADSFDSISKSDDENFEEQKERLHLMLEELSIRQCFSDDVEGDDLIAYYCQHKQSNEKIYIVSADKDLVQLLAPDIAIYSPNLKDFVTYQNCQDKHGVYYENMVLLKTIVGDSSDNIKGIKGVGEKTLIDIIPEITKRKITLDEVFSRVRDLSQERVGKKLKPLKSHENILNGVTDGCQGDKIYEINEKLINLSSPLLTDEAVDMMDGIMDAPIDPEGRSFENLYNLIIKYDIFELTVGERFSNFFEPFKSLANREINFYKKNS